MYAEKVFGCLMGGAIGDALGMPFEDIPGSRIEKLYNDELFRDFVDGLPYPGLRKNVVNAGSVTDDTEMILTTAESIVSNSAIVVKDIADNLLKWIRRELSWLKGSPEDKNIGVTTREALERYASGVSYKESGISSGGCGAAIRISPVALGCFNDFEKMRSAVFAISQITHRNPRKPLAEEGALCIAASIRHILLGKSLSSLPEYLLSLAKTKEFRQQIERLETGLSEGWGSKKAVDTFGCGSAALATEVVTLAMFNFLRFPEDFRQAVLTSAKTRSKGGCDTDCIASLTGALAGCYLGVDQIPIHWREKVQYRDELRSLSQDLSKLISSSNGRVRFEE